MAMRLGRTVPGSPVFAVALATGKPRAAFSPVRTAVTIPRGMLATRRMVAMRAVAAARTAPVVGPAGATALASAMRPVPI